MTPASVVGAAAGEGATHLLDGGWFLDHAWAIPVVPAVAFLAKIGRAHV